LVVGLVVGLAVGLAEGLFARNRHRYRHALGKPTADCTVNAQAKAIQRYRTHRNGRFLTDDSIGALVALFLGLLKTCGNIEKFIIKAQWRTSALRFLCSQLAA
jgi:hypothetical protein